MNQQNSIGFSKHRLEALTDGIFAVVMTLLVIELKIPENFSGKTEAALLHHLAELLPRAISWVVSFFVLAIFWISNHRQMHFVRVVDGKLVVLTMLFLAFASCMPFSSSLAGPYVMYHTSQIVYGSNMFLIGVMSLLICRYIYRHPQLSITPMPKATYHAARFRTGGLLLVAIFSIAISYYWRGAGNVAFLLMIPISVLARRFEAKHLIMGNNEAVHNAAPNPLLATTTPAPAFKKTASKPKRRNRS
jgi:uncharacterized membrane protein